MTSDLLGDEELNITLEYYMKINTLTLGPFIKHESISLAWSRFYDAPLTKGQISCFAYCVHGCFSN